MIVKPIAEYRHDNENTMCFTGPRPKSFLTSLGILSGVNPYDITFYKQFRKDLFEYVKKLVKQGYSRFITGGAQGFDQLAFWAVNECKQQHPYIQNIVFAPFENQESRWPVYSTFGQRDYYKMLGLADEVYIVSEENSVKALFDRNIEMCKHSCHVTAAVPKGNPASSGTWHCMESAMKRKMSVTELRYEIRHSQLAIVQTAPSYEP